MKLSMFKEYLASARQVNFVQPNGQFVPRHFHITAAGLAAKHFIDCGGIIRTEKKINFQVWVANDIAHRLAPEKLLGIIKKAEPLFGKEDLEIEIEYQNDTIGKYSLDIQEENFLLIPTFTDCLAKENCGIPVSDLLTKEAPAACCTPGGGCC